jgi:hypothetical protein
MVPHIDTLVTIESGASALAIPVNEGHVDILSDMGDKHEFIVIELVGRCRGPPFPITATPRSC